MWPLIKTHSKAPSDVDAIRLQIHAMLIRTLPLRGLVLLLTLSLTPAMTRANLIDEIVIIKGSDNAYFDETITTLARHVEHFARIRVVQQADLAREFSDHPEHSLFIAFGPSAVAAVKQFDQRVPLISAYLTHEQYRELAIDDQFAVLLDQPMKRYLTFCKLLLNADSIGVISDRGIDTNTPSITPSDTNPGLTVNQYRVDPTNKLLPVLRELLQENDALLMLPRQSIYNQDSLKGVLLTSYRNRKPAISYSPAHVRSGALASIYSSPIDIGRHLALIVKQRLMHPGSAAPAYEFARYYSITSNRRIAQALAIKLPDEGDLRAQLDRIQP
jgi:putative ABC transport system substrate-binding protein